MEEMRSPLLDNLDRHQLISSPEFVKCCRKEGRLMLQDGAFVPTEEPDVVLPLLRTESIIKPSC